MCVWLLLKPGMMTRPRTSITRLAPFVSMVLAAPTAEMESPSIATAPLRTTAPPFMGMTMPLVRTRSWAIEESSALRGRFGEFVGTRLRVTLHRAHCRAPRRELTDEPIEIVTDGGDRCAHLVVGVHLDSFA